MSPTSSRAPLRKGCTLEPWQDTVDLIQRVSTGLEVKGDVLRIDPQLPHEMERLDMRIRYRGHSLDLRLTHDSLTVLGRDAAAPPIAPCADGKITEFVGGTTRVFRLNDEVTEGGLDQYAAKTRNVAPG